MSLTVCRSDGAPDSVIAWCLIPPVLLSVFVSVSSWTGSCLSVKEGGAFTLVSYKL